MLVLLADEADDQAVLAGTAGAARAMDVVGLVGRRVEVHDARDVIDVDAASGDVGGAEDRHTALREGVQGTVTLRLRAATVEVGRANTRGVELLGETIDAVPGAAERDHRAGAQNEVDEQVDAVVRLDLPEVVRDVADRTLLGDRLVADRVVLVLTSDLLDFAVERGGEEQRLAVRLNLVEEATDDGQEAHVGHAVGLVEHDDMDVGEIDITALDQVLEAAGARDEDLDATAQRALLRAVAGTAVDGSTLEAARRGQRLDLAHDLLGEFARRGEDQRRRALRLRGFDLRGDGEAEGDGLARARGGTAGDVEALKGVGDGVFLDRERGLNALARQYGRKVSRHTEIGERGGHGTPIEQFARSS